MWVIRKNHYYYYVVPLTELDDFEQWCSNKDDFDFLWSLQDEDAYLEKYKPVELEELILQKWTTSSE
jgi:hypothetical protein